MKDDKSPYVRIAELEAEVRELRALLKPDMRKFEPWGLTNAEHVILSAIAAGNGACVSRERLHRTVYGRRYVGPVALRSHVFHLRKKMSPHGVTIFCRSLQGYWIDAAGLKIVRAATQ